MKNTKKAKSVLALLTALAVFMTPLFQHSIFAASSNLDTTISTGTTDNVPSGGGSGGGGYSGGTVVIVPSGGGSSSSSSGGGGGSASGTAPEGCVWGTCISKDIKTGTLTVEDEDGNLYTATEGLCVSVGASGWFLIDDSGKAANYTEIPYSDFNIGWLSKTSTSAYQSTGEEFLLMQIFTDKSYSFDMADSITVNGAAYSDIKSVYNLLKDYKGAVAFKYDSSDSLRYYRITELRTVETPVASNLETCYNSESMTLTALEGFAISNDTEIIWAADAGSVSKTTLDAEYTYTVSAYAYDRYNNIRLLAVTKASLSKFLFYAGDMQQKSNGIYISTVDKNNAKKSYKLADEVNFNGSKLKSTNEIFSSFSALKEPFFAALDNSGCIVSATTEYEKQSFDKVIYSAADNTLGGFYLDEKNVIEVYDLYNQTNERLSPNHFYSYGNGLNENTIYSGTLCTMGEQNLFFVTQKSPITRSAPNVKFAASATFEDADFSPSYTAFAKIDKNDFEDEGLVVIAAYKDGDLKAAKSVNLNDFNACTNIHLTVKQESGLVFRCFVFDKNCTPLDNLPSFNSKMAQEINDSKVTKLKGEIKATPYSSTMGNTDAKAMVKMYVTDNFETENDDFLTTNKTYQLLTGSSDVCDFLGYSVVAYVGESRDYPGEYEVITVEKDTLANKEVVIPLDSYDSFANGKLEYYAKDTDRNTTKLTLDSNVKVVYNNVGGYTLSSVFGPLVQKYMTESGYIRLIDNDSEYGYDVIFVEIGTPAVIDEVTTAKISFKEPAILATGGSINSLNIDKNTTDEKVIILKDGKEIDTADLCEWDVLNIIAEDKNAGYIVAEVITAFINGTVSMITESNTSDTDFAYRINGKTYDANANSYMTNCIEIGNTGTFYINKYGKLAAFNEDTSNQKYAYVLKTSYDQNNFDEYTTQLKLVTADSVATYKLAEKTAFYRADGTKIIINTENHIPDSLDNELIRYTTNSAGKIASITFADYNTDKFEYVRSETNADFDLKLMRIGKTDIDKDSVVFLIDSSNDSVCMVGTIADIDDGQFFSSYDAYRDSNGDKANILIVTGYNTVATSAPLAVIKTIGVAYNDDLDNVLVLDYYKDGELCEGVYTNSDVYANSAYSLNEGDIVQLKISSKGIITGIKTLVDFESRIRSYNGFENITVNGTLSNGAYTYKRGRLTTAFGYATEYSKSSKTAVIGGNDYRLSNAKNVYVINPALRKNKVSTGSVDEYRFDSELMEDYNMYNISVDGTTITVDNAEYIYNAYADFLFVREYDGIVKDVVIIKTYDDSYSVEIN